MTHSRFSKFITLCAITWLCLPVSGFSQFYQTVQRPNVDWKEIHTEHFWIIFHDDFEETALRAARLLEHEYNSIHELVGGKLSNFPVIINGYNDLSNGYVSSHNFRMEVEAPPLTGKILNPRTGGHLENLMAHELVHALQFSVKTGYTGILHLFSPDLGRSVHGFVPLGMIEGFAVYQESQLNNGDGGRGNHAPFVQQFNANLGSSSPWNMGQLMTPPGASRPTGRFYISGYMFTSWFVENYGLDYTKNSVYRQAHFPFIGYPAILWIETGDSPWKLYRNFSADMRSREQIRLDSLRQIGFSPFEVVHMGSLNGSDVHQPKWISDNEVLYYGRYYNNRSGFWIYNTDTDSHSLFHETSMHESFGFDISCDMSRLIYARYSAHQYHENRYTADVHEFNFETRKTTRLSTKNRLHSPVYTQEDEYFYALQTDFDTHKWVAVYADSIVKKSALRPDNIVQVAVNPSQPSLHAIIANRNGVQGLWITQRGYENDILPQSPDIFFENGAIYDAKWHPDGLRLLFTGERNGLMNIYEYNYALDKLHQLTQSAYNAMEASYSPNDEQLAMVIQHDNYRRLTLLNRAELLNKEVPRDAWQPNLQHRLSAPRLADELINLSETWEVRNYRTGSAWLKPRAFFPTLRQTSTNNNFSYGAIIGSGDVLRRNAYSFELTYGNSEFLYDFRYTYSGFFPSVELRTALEPYVPGGTTDGSFAVFGQERINSIRLPISIRFDDPTGSTALFIAPEFRLNESRLRARRSGSDVVIGETDWQGSYRLRLGAALNYRLKQHLRDAQPNSGFRAYTQLDYDMFSTGDAAPFEGLRFGVQAYVAPLMEWNQSLRIGVELIRQNRFGYNLLGIVHEGFDVAGITFESQNLALFSTRYTVPLLYPDTGGFFVPVYLERVYAVLFTQTLANNFTDDPLTLAGAGIRARVRLLYNFPIDIGIGFAIIPGRTGSESVVINF